MSKSRAPSAEPDRLGQTGIEACGPPWILGWRGLPLEAPENTAASFLRALEAGLDGIHYDLRACMGGDIVVMRDAHLERTTDGVGALADRSLSELFGLDAGGWFAKAFTGEPVPHFDDVLDLCSSRSPEPLHLIELHEPDMLPELARRVSSIHPPLSLRVATNRRDLCLEVRDLGLGSVLLADRANESDLAFVRDERIDGLGVTNPRGWRTEVGGRSWPLERWILGISETRDLFDALRDGVHGITTSEPRRAQAMRSLFSLCGRELEEPPIEADPLQVLTSSEGTALGEWRGEWAPRVRLTNPFSFDCRVTLELYVRRGAFEREGLPRTLELGPGQADSVHFALRGGSWSPGGDPILAALYEWKEGPGRPRGCLLFDLSLRRERTVIADVITQRLEMLRESPGQVRASMTVQRHASRIAVRVENPGDLRDVRSVVSLGGSTWIGASSLRLPLPEGFDTLDSGVPFACGFYGRREGDGQECLRRWSGGLPADPGNGGPGRMYSRRWA